MLSLCFPSSFLSPCWSLCVFLAQSSRMKMQNQIEIWNGNGNKLIERKREEKKNKHKKAHTNRSDTHMNVSFTQNFNSQTLLWWTFAHRVCIKNECMQCTLLLFSPAVFRINLVCFFHFALGMVLLHALDTHHHMIAVYVWHLKIAK